MNDHLHKDCEHFEAMIAASFDADGIRATERQELAAHLATCASCRESHELSTRMETALVARRSEVPAAAAFLPRFAPERARVIVHAHPRLLAAFRTLMSPAGIGVVLVMWSAMLALRYRHAISEVFAFTETDRFAAVWRDASTLLIGLSGGDAYTLTAIYIALALAVLASTGAITLKYIRHS
jgi:anti-sigma factor RsiW